MVILTGFTNQKDAENAFRDRYGCDPSSITAMTLPQFKAWLESDTSRPVGVMETAPSDGRSQRETLLREAMAHLWGDGKIYP